MAYPPQKLGKVEVTGNVMQLSDGTYTEAGRLAIMQKICDLVCDKQTLDCILREHKLPMKQTIYTWMSQNPLLAKMYNDARATRAFSRGDKIDAITELVLSGALDPNSARVVIDAEKWQMTREAPRLFGDRIAVEHDVSGELAQAMQAARLRVSAIEQTPVSTYLPDTSDTDQEDFSGNSEQ